MWLFLPSTDHVPAEAGDPVEDRFDAADQLKVFGFANSLLDQKKDKTGRHRGHGDHDGVGKNLWCYTEGVTHKQQWSVQSCWMHTST